MKRELAKEIQDKNARIVFLTDNCDKAEKKSYMRPFTADELLSMKEELSENAIRIDDIETEKKDAIAEFRERLKLPLLRKSELLTGIKSKSELVTEECYKFIDLESREVGYYNQNGDLIEQRPAYGDELQSNIFQMQRTGTF